MATFSAMIMRCTAKARGLLGVRQLVEPEHSPDDWYANLLWSDRRKCLLLAHVGTLFPVFVADVRKADLTRLDRWLANVVRRELSAESLPAAVLGELAPPIVFAKTASRQMLGLMNEMARFAEYAIADADADADAGGLARCDIAELNRHQRRMMHNRNGDYVRPIELVTMQPKLRSHRPSPK